MDELIDAIEGISRGEAVVVVAEKIVRPRSGPLLSFSGEAEHGRSGSSAWIIATIAVLVLAALAAYWLVGIEAKEADDGEKVGAVQESESEQRPPKAALPIVPKEKPKEAVTAVHVVLSSNVDAEIYDAAKDKRLGSTNTEEGIYIEPDRIPIKLELRADGYVDQVISVENTEEFKHEVQLEAEPKAKAKAKKKTKKKVKHKTNSVGSGSGSGGGVAQIKDPFAGVGK